MTASTVAAYGTWKSPITSDLIVAGTIGLGGAKLDGTDLYWQESRPSEGGRSVIVKRTASGATDITPKPFNVRTRVHEYGGGASLIQDGTVYFVNFADQQLYRQAVGEEPVALTSPGAMRYADMLLDAARQRLICVREDHSQADHEPVNTLVSVSLASNDAGQVLASGHDFFASPRLSSDGSRLAWITWDHPNMPWDGTELWVAEIDDTGSLTNIQKVAGGMSESIFQPEWSPDGVLHFVSDRTGWWNLYRWHQGNIEALYPMEAEFGEPQWVFGQSTYGFIDRDRILCTYVQDGINHLAILNTRDRTLLSVPTPYTSIGRLQVSGDWATFIGGSPTEAAAVILLNWKTSNWEVCRRSSDLEIDTGYLSVPQVLAFPTENGLTAYGFFYPPANKDYQAPEGEKPPLLVKSHGGPTASTSTVLNLSNQYWTSRGIAVLDVNYGGSTGYGREYRDRLKNQWGIVDVDDCVNGAKYLADQGLVDSERLMIKGGSAGGYTTLCALTFKDVFKAGASYYGVSDLEALAQDTHKFESRYLDSLIGPYPERKDLYEQRSPIHFTEQLACPVIFFQGSEDKVVPPNQAECMVDAIKAKGLPVAYVLFEGEQHGFRRAENIKRALDGEFYFYAQVFGYPMADTVEPVPITNL